MSILDLKDSDLNILINKYNKELETIKVKNLKCKSDVEKVSNLNRYLHSQNDTFWEKININDFKKNLCLLHLDRIQKRVFLLINYNISVFPIDIIHYKWFVRHRIKTPFAIKKDRGKDIHCIFISLDFNRKSFLGVENNIAEIVLDDEVPLNIYLGNPQKFICIDIAKKFNRNDFSTSTQKNYS